MINTKILIYVVVFFIYSVLKPFVDDFLYNMFAATYGPGTDTTALYYGLCAGIFAVSAYACARWLCKRWDKKQSSKGQRISHTEEVSEAIAPEAEIIEPTPTIADPTAPAPATPKLRYCKLCGAPIDPATRKCTDCRKQYFRLPHLNKKHLFLGVGVLACVLVAALIFNLTSRLSAADARIAELNGQIQELSSNVTELEDTVSEQKRQINVYKRNESSYRGQLSSKDDTIENLREKNNLMNNEIAFYDRHVVFIADDGTRKYHNYSCEYLDLSYFWAYNVEAARDRGYKPCSHCCD